MVSGSRTASGAGSIWTITSTSAVANPTGAASRRRTVSGKVRVTTTYPIIGNEAWRYVFSNAAGCTVVDNSVTLESPMFIQGSLCLENPAEYRGPLLDVRGTLDISGNASVGIASDPVPDVRVKLGCRNETRDPFSTSNCDAAHRVWATRFSPDPPNVTKPTLTIGDAFAAALPGPGVARYCTQDLNGNPSSFPGGTNAFGTNATINAGDPVVQLLPSAAYNCVVTRNGELVGRIGWSGGSSGTLTVEGTVFFDGSLLPPNNTTATYVTPRGSATIYFTGSVLLDNSVQICAVAGCATSWNANSSMLYIISGSNVTIENRSRFQGGLYAAGGFSLGNRSEMQGPVIADSLSIDNNTTLHSWTPLTELPGDVPANGSPVNDLDYVADSFRG